jgi:hypothetical protein
MSIAVSALVRPSRALRLLLGACGLAQLAAALAVGLALPERFLCAPLQAGLLALAGTALLGAALARVKTQRLDISGTGDLRVTVQQDVGGGETNMHADAEIRSRDGQVHERHGRHAGHDTETLLPGSVIWPALMSVRHAAPTVPPNARPRTLLIARDSVDAASWRALAVALSVVGRAGMRTTDAKTR